MCCTMLEYSQALTASNCRIASFRIYFVYILQVVYLFMKFTYECQLYILVQNCNTKNAFSMLEAEKINA